MKIEFYSLIEGIDLMYPPVPYSKIKMNWVAGAKEAYLRTLDQKVGDNVGGSHLCSGIRELLDIAYVIPAWHDLIIKTNGDLEFFEWKTPKTNATLLKEYEAIEYFGKEMFGDHTNLPPQTLKTILKFPTPWRVKLPKGYGLLYMPLHYADENRFTSLTGVLEPEVNNALNAVLFWHEVNDEILVKAGTPLFAVVPVKIDEKMEVIIREANEKELKYERVKINIIFSIWKNKALKLKELSDKFWGK